MGSLDANVQKLWLSQRFSMGMIATQYGCTRQAVFYHLRKLGIDTSKNISHIKLNCPQCQAPFTIHRSRERQAKKHFCSQVCYMDSIRNPNYKGNRQGQRDARELISQHFNLLSEHIVHHIDSDNRHNWPSNLIVFKSQSDHLKWHRNGLDQSGVTPLLFGSTIQDKLTEELIR